MTDHSLILSGHRGLFSDSASCQLDCEVVSSGIQAKNANSFEIPVRFFIGTYDTSLFHSFAITNITTVNPHKGCCEKL